MDSNDPRILMFKMDALQRGVPPAIVDAYIAQQLGETNLSTAKAETGLASSQLGLEKDKIALEEAKKTPEEKGTSAAKEEIAKKKALANAGLGDEKSADQKKADLAYNATINFINSLESTYKKSGGGKIDKGIGARLKGAELTAEGKLGYNDAATNYNDAVAGFAATLKETTGDTGVMTNQDFDRLRKLLPSLGSTKGEQTQKFEMIKKQVASKFGKIVSTEVKKDIKQNKLPTKSEPLNKILYPEGQIQGGQAKNMGMDDNTRKAIEYAQKARKTQDPQQKAILMAQANAYSKAAQAQPQEKLNPVVNTAGNVQSFLGNSETLPVVGGLLGRAILPNGIGSGVGAATGEALKQASRRGGIEAVLAPTMDERMAALKTGVVTGGTDLLLSGLLKGGKRILHPRAALSASKSAAATAAEKAGIEFQVTDGMKEAANYILEKKDYLEPAQKKILTAIVNNETLSPTEVAKMQPILRTAGRTLSNSALRSSEGQAFNHIYDTTLEQSKTLAPKMYKATADIAKTFPKKASELEPIQRILHKAISPAAYGVATGAAMTGAYALLNKLGLTVPGQGGQ